MKKLILIALIPVIMLGCKNTGEKTNTVDKDQKKEQKKNENSDEQASTLTEVGQTVPGFSFQTGEGEEYSMEELRGNVVVLNFFATWCPSCMKEMPALQEQVWKNYKDNDNFFMVSIGREHSMEEMKKFKEEKGYPFSFAPDTGRVIYGKFAEKYIPRNVVVDKDGKIIYQCAGYKKEEFDKMLGILEDKLN